MRCCWWVPVSFCIHSWVPFAKTIISRSYLHAISASSFACPYLPPRSLSHMSRSSVCPLFRTDSASSPPSRIRYFGSVRTSSLHVLSRALRIILCWSFRGADSHAGGSDRPLCAIASMHARNRQCPSLGTSITR